MDCIVRLKGNHEIGNDNFGLEQNYLWLGQEGITTMIGEGLNRNWRSSMTQGYTVLYFKCSFLFD